MFFIISDEVVFGKLWSILLLPVQWGCTHEVVALKAYEHDYKFIIVEIFLAGKIHFRSLQMISQRLM